MEINWIAIGATLIAGFSTGLGALPIYFKKQFSKDTLNVGLGFSAGVMLVASFVALILPGIEEASLLYRPNIAILSVLASVFVGYLFIVVIHEILPHEHLLKAPDVKNTRKLSRVSLIILAIALHNIPEGLTVGVGFGSDNLSSGLSLALAISLQNMPEGLVVAIGLISEGASKHRAFIIALLTGLVEPVAALFGFASTQITQFSLPIALGFAGGAMLFVTSQEVFPEVFKEGNEKRASLGVVIGIMVMLGLDFYLGG